MHKKAAARGFPRNFGFSVYLQGLPLASGARGSRYAGAARRHTMRKVFHIAVIALLAYLVGDRAMLHAQARDASSQTCAQGAQQKKLDALGKGFGEAAASSQGEAFMSGCLVTG